MSRLAAFIINKFCLRTGDLFLIKKNLKSPELGHFSPIFPTHDDIIVYKVMGRERALLNQQILLMK